jgi:hypothetical protein
VESRQGVLLANSSRIVERNTRIGMLIIMVRSATRMVNTGPDGGFRRLHRESVLLHVH